MPNTNAIEKTDLIDTRCAARILNLVPSTLVTMRYKDKGPPYYKLGAHKRAPIRYSIADLNEYVERISNEGI